MPKKGSVLNHGEYEDFKKYVQSLATRKGYFQGRFTKNELGVSRERREAYWRLAYDSGPRWHFGPVSFSGGQIDADMLEPLVPFKDGEPYAAPKLAQLNENLADTGWFSSAVVAPDFKQADVENHIVPMSGRSLRAKATLLKRVSDIQPMRVLALRANGKSRG